MHIVNSIPKATVLGMDGNCAKFYKYYVPAPSTIAVDVFQQVYNRFVNVLALGAWPEVIGPYFSDGRAILFIKEALHIDLTSTTSCRNPTLGQVWG
jgi:hypothetical protein